MTRSAQQRYAACLSSLLLAVSFTAAGSISAPPFSQPTARPSLVLASASPIVLM